MTTNNVKILIVEDSAIYATALRLVVEELNYAELIGVASNGKIGLQKIASLKPDLVFSDLEMPQMNGIEMIKSIKTSNPKLPVIIISSHDKNSSTLGLEALTLGALDFIQKPTTATLTIDEIVKSFVTKLQPYIHLIKTKKATYKHIDKVVSAPVISKPVPAFVPIRLLPLNIKLIVIGISTGGPNTLAAIIPQLHLPYKMPILIVQHIPPFFAESLANRLDKSCDLKVVIAEDGMIAKGGDIVIAPGGKHMIVDSFTINTVKLKLVDFPPVHGCKPAVDILLQSVVQKHQNKVVTFILTGMGKDGCAGVSKLRDIGAYSIIQDEESSTVWGMPGAIFEAEQYDEILSQDQIAIKLNQLGK
ncbi:chemotaxis-specific protein-glutamate methyltransferase CheB [bacterium]|nr:chemotaxis-specific protein-glutamate methyltransferase CheB [bacterium]